MVANTHIVKKYKIFSYIFTFVYQEQQLDHAWICLALTPAKYL